jgi:GNAT superfamily N-acetyltransferase
MVGSFYLILYQNKFDTLKVKELHDIQEMLSHFDVIQFLYPNITIEKYESHLREMIPHNYAQLAVFDEEICVGLTGFWTGTKLWSGKYIEIDNFIVHPDHRQKGVGKAMTNYLNQKAKELGCTMIVLDAFTGNFKAHRFYYNQGYSPKGFHFVKMIDKSGLA